ncbi:MAG: hypothetical protein JRG91_16920, partial [Deltaproteobacteria bacterium]|nr:hypothetical protein [Deltaproteobacteria bacterium]
MMRTTTAILLSIALTACSGSGTGDEPEEITCSNESPAAGTVVNDVVDVQINVTGPVTRVELLAGDAVVAGIDVAQGCVSATLSWDTTDLADGAVVLEARVTSEADAEATSDARDVTVDNTAPTASFGPDFPRISVISGEAAVPVLIEEDNVESIVLSNADGELASTTES